MRKSLLAYRALPLAAASLAIFGLVACSTPFERQSNEDLRRSIVSSAARELAEARQSPQVRTVRSVPTDLEFTPERLEELRKMAGPESYTGVLPSLGEDLLGRVDDHPAFRITLEQAIAATVSNNLAVQIARIDPAVGQAGVVAAQAAFDWVFFSTFEWAITDQPSAVPVINGVPIGVGVSQSQTVSYSTGLRKALTSGGTFSVSQGQVYSDNSTPGTTIFPDPSNSVFANFRFEQPLLRNFGSSVTLAEVRIAENLERDAVYALKASMITAVAETEDAYWSLVAAHRALQVRQRLLERGIETRDVLRSRLGVDARPAEFSDAVARVESRQADVIRAINQLRLASDRLKQLINDPELTVGSETLLLPMDDPVEEPFSFSLADLLSQSISYRPEIQRAILAIDNASIRQTVADNARLPRLDFAIETTLRGLDRSVGDAYEDLVDSRFMNWLMTLAFEQPIGNRAAEAGFRARQLQRLQETLRYRQAVQNIVFDLKTVLRNLETNYKLIQQTRTSRLAAAENLRTLLVLERTIATLSPDFLNLKLNRQEALALAELEEIQALVEYNSALADLYRATGTALERNGIRFIIPDAGELQRSAHD